MRYPSFDCLRRAFVHSSKPKPHGLLATLMAELEPEARPCPRCNGTGHVIRYRMDGSKKSDMPCSCREQQPR